MTTATVTLDYPGFVHFPACNDRCEGDSHYLQASDEGGPAQSGTAAFGVTAALVTNPDPTDPETHDEGEPA